VGTESVDAENMGSESMSYRASRAPAPPPLDGEWEASEWSAVRPAEVAWFHPAGSGHRPRTLVRVLYDRESLYVFFRVEDRYVRAVASGFQGPVYEDSCVEFFVRPRQEAGYFNFEMNCGGTLLLYYIEDPRRRAGGFARFVKVDERHVAGMKVHHSLPRVVEPESTRPVTWTVAYNVPLSLLREYAGEVSPDPGCPWRCNFYKCGDKTSHPHWGAWSPVGEELNFHQPERFGTLEFAP
jgi:hypothetical protein